MAGKIITNWVALGDHATDSNNFVLKTNVDGTATFARGAAGNLGTVFGVNANNTITGATITVAATAAPAFSAYLSANQATTNLTWTKITFDTEEFDTNSNFASGRFTPTVSGYYQINGCTNGGASASSFGRSISQIYKNGIGYKTGADYAVTGSNGLSVVASIVYLNGSTDYVEIYAYINATSPSVLSGMTNAYFNGAMVRSA